MTDQKEIWNDVWASSAYAQPLLRQSKAVYKLNALEQILDAPFEGFALDIGCGGGYVSAEISRRGARKVVGIDFSQSAIDLAIKHHSSETTSFRVADGCSGFLQHDEIGTFDRVFVLGVLEHNEHPEEILHQSMNALRSGGKLIVSTSNTHSVYHAQYLLFNALGIWPYGHLKHYSDAQLSKLLSDCGFIPDSSVILACNASPVHLSLLDRLTSILPRVGRYCLMVATKL